MEYINLKYNSKLNRKRHADIRMGSFELEATSPYDDGKTICRVGQLSMNFKLVIPISGKCRVPDTQHNRDALKLFTTKQTIKVHGKKVTNEPCFELLSEINLKDPAPLTTERALSQEEIQKMLLENEALKKKVEVIPDT